MHGIHLRWLSEVVIGYCRSGTGLPTHRTMSQHSIRSEANGVTSRLQLHLGRDRTLYGHASEEASPGLLLPLQT